MSARNFDGRVPDPGELDERDRAVLELGPKTLDVVADFIERVELRAGMRAGMDAAAEVNAYLNATEPWRVLKEDPERGGTILWVTIQAIAAIRVALYPYLPHSAATIGEMLGTGADIAGWAAPEIASGTRLGQIEPVFTKLDSDALDD